MASAIIPWADHIRRSKKLTIFIDDSIAKQGWGTAFKNAVEKFNELSRTTWKLGVVLETAVNSVIANIVVYAKSGDFEFGYKDADYELPKEKKVFDGQSVHGLCSLLHSDIRNPATRTYEPRLVKAFIFVPAKPHTSGPHSRLVGEPVKLVVAVHELIHACGGLDNSHHTVDDVFCWPKPKFDSMDPAQDRLEAFSGQRKEVIIAGRKIMQPVMVPMPPVFLNPPTQNKIRNVWK